MENKENKDRIDRDELRGEKRLDITNEIVKLYQNDPISNKVISYLLSKYKIIPINALESIKQHREEILLNIVLCYKKMWEMRIKKMADTIEMSNTPKKIIIGMMEGKNEGNQTKGNESRPESNSIEGKHSGRDNCRKNNKGISHKI